MEHWLHCTISRGAFTGEYIVAGETSDGRGFSLFAEGKHLKAETALPSDRDRKVDGWIRVELIEVRDGLALVRLPHEALERGYFITVPAGNVTPGEKVRRLEPA